jgi:hypothetical protein
MQCDNSKFLTLKIFQGLKYSLAIFIFFNNKVWQGFIIINKMHAWRKGREGWWDLWLSAGM